MCVCVPNSRSKVIHFSRKINRPLQPHTKSVVETTGEMAAEAFKTCSLKFALIPTPAKIDTWFNIFYCGKSAAQCILKYVNISQTNLWKMEWLCIMQKCDITAFSFNKSSKVNKFVIGKNLKHWPNSQQKKKKKEISLKTIVLLHCFGLLNMCLGVWFSLRVWELLGSNPAQAPDLEYK